jgi:hypothetical protein
MRGDKVLSALSSLCGLALLTVACTSGGSLTPGQGGEFAGGAPSEVEYWSYLDPSTERNSSVLRVPLESGGNLTTFRTTSSDCSELKSRQPISEGDAARARELLGIRHLLHVQFVDAWPDTGMLCQGFAFDPETGDLVHAVIPEDLDCSFFHTEIPAAAEGPLPTATGDVELDPSARTVNCPPPEAADDPSDQLFYCPESCQVGSAPLQCPAVPQFAPGMRLVKYMDTRLPLGRQVFVLDPSSTDPEVVEIRDFLDDLTAAMPVPTDYEAPPSGYAIAGPSSAGDAAAPAASPSVSATVSTLSDAPWPAGCSTSAE